MASISRKQSIAITTVVLLAFFGIGTAMLFQSEEHRSLAGEKEPSSEVAASIPPVKEEEAARFALHDFHRSETRNGKKLWEVRAEKGEYFPGTNSAQIERGTLWFFKENGEVTQLIAGSATIYLEGATLSSADARGGVRMIINEKLEIETTRARYDRVKNSVSSPDPVIITTERFRVTGQVLSADLEKKEFTLAERVETVLFRKTREATENG